MRNIDQHTITPAVTARLAACGDPRLKQIMTALVRHLHDFAREVKLTEPEWMQGISSSPPPAKSVMPSGRSSSCCRTRWACRC